MPRSKRERSTSAENRIEAVQQVEPLPAPPGSTAGRAEHAAPAATVCLTAVTPFWRLLHEQGPEIMQQGAEHFDSLVQRWGLDGSELHTPTARLPHTLMVQLLEDVERMLGDPAAGVRAALKLQKGDYDLLEYLCSTTPTLGDSIKCLQHYYPLLIAADLTLHVHGNVAETRFRIVPGLDAPNSMHEYALVSNLIMTMHHLRVDEHLSAPLSVHFTHAEPSHVDTLRDIFPCPVHFNADHNAVRFPRGMLQQPMAHADPALHNVLLRLADQEMDALFERSAFPTKVRAAIEATLDRGAALDDVAKALRVSPNTLRTRLRQYGTTYSVLLEQYRRTYAKRALCQSQMSVAELAHRLGFAHPPAFTRAFKRWFGVAPHTFRENTRRPLTERFLPARASSAARK